jgi:hypothetical protein
LTGFISCTNDDKIIQEQIELINRSSITLNGVEYETINDIYSGNENCDNLYVKASFYKIITYKSAKSVKSLADIHWRAAHVVLRFAAENKH